MPQELDSQHWRPITFEGVELPQSFMAISILENEPTFSEDTSRWLWSFTICCGITKSDRYDLCQNSAEEIRNFLLDHPIKLKMFISERLEKYGFNPDLTFSEWIESLTLIIELSQNKFEDCIWSAPSHLEDTIRTQSDAEKFLNNLDKAFKRNSNEESDTV